MIVDVVLVRAKSRTPSEISQLATAISAHYRVPAEAVEAKLLHGSFRVKSRTDIETARRYQHHLDALGAVCEIRDSTSGHVIAPSPPPEAVSNHSISASPTLVAAHELDPTMAGLAAAQGTFSADLGALNAGMAHMLSLAPLDERRDNPANPTVSIEAPTDRSAPLIDLDGPVPSELGPVGDGAHIDQRFAPPSDTSNPEVLTLALDPDLDGPPVTAVPMPATMAPRPLPSPTTDVHQQLFAAPNEQTKEAKPSLDARIRSVIAVAKSGLASRSRGAFVTGVATAMLAGFLIAHVVGVIQESHAYPSARKELLASYAEATDASSHAGLASIRESTLDLIHSRQTKIATTSLLIWVVVSAVIGFVWFRLIGWERLNASTPQGPQTRPPNPDASPNAVTS